MLSMLRKVRRLFPKSKRWMISLVTGDIDGGSLTLHEIESPTKHAALWFNYFDEMGHGQPMMRPYLVLPATYEIFRVPQITFSHKCTWSNDGNLAAFCLVDGEVPALLLWNVSKRQTAKVPLPYAWWYKFQFESGLVLRGNLDPSMRRGNTIPQTLEFSLRALEWKSFTDDFPIPL